MYILVINSGSSSIKYQLVEIENEKTLASGLIERVGLSMGKIKHKKNNKLVYEKEKLVETHSKGIDILLELLLDKDLGFLTNYHEISAVGHRVVHGGEDFTHSIIIDDEVISVLEKKTYLAPLHNPPNLLGIKASLKLMPDIKNIAVFDTAFHQTMPQVAYIYSLPYEFYEKYGIRKYGFHGTSHQFVALKAAEMLNKDISEVNLITCHLGNGCSLAAIKNGESIDTSLGYGTMCGVMMGTRAGDIDPAIILTMMEELELDSDEIKNILYKKSGLLGISKISSDMRDIETQEDLGDKKAKLSLDIFADRVRKYIGSYAVTLGRVDAIIFTAGVGENGWEIRERICKGLEVLEADLDIEENKVRGKQKEVSKKESKVKIFVIPTNEEMMIAKETKRLIM